MQSRVRPLLVLLAALFLSGCAAMMMGGGNSGGYKPPQDRCEEGDQGCKPRQVVEPGY